MKRRRRGAAEVEVEVEEKRMKLGSVTVSWLREVGETLERGRIRGLLEYDPSPLLKRLWSVVPRG